MPSGTEESSRLTEAALEKLDPPERGSRLHFDADVPGLAVRITANSVIAFVLCYSVHGRRRRYTIGRWPELSIKGARDAALDLRKAIRGGADPLNQKIQDREASTMKDLADRYLSDHATRKNRASTIRNNKAMLETIILPRFGHFPVASITKADIERLHHRLRPTPYRANRALALWATMFKLAIEWGYRPDNPAQYVEKYAESKRDRWLSEEEMGRLKAALPRHRNVRGVQAITLILLTGSRKGEVLHATWDQFDFDRAVWRKPATLTKQNKVEHVPLNKPAIRLLRAIRKHSGESEYLFPGMKAGRPLEDLRKTWRDLCAAANLKDVRIHDLRHTFASHLVSEGESLPVVGSLLGHRQSQTTERYAHLADRTRRKASERFGDIFQKAKRRG